MHALAAAADQRRAELGARLGQDPPQWAREALGAVPDADTDPDGLKLVNLLPALADDLEVLVYVVTHETGHHVLGHAVRRFKKTPVGKRAEVMASLSPLYLWAYEQRERNAQPAKPAPIAGTTPGIEPSGLSRCTRPGTGTQDSRPRV